MFQFVMFNDQVGVYATDEYDDPANVGERPNVVASTTSKEVIRINDAPVPSLIQLEFTDRYAIKISDRSFLQFADLQGHSTTHGGFVGFSGFHNGYVMVQHPVNESEFLEQISQLRLKILQVVHEQIPPAKEYIVRKLLQDLSTAAANLK